MSNPVNSLRNDNINSFNPINSSILTDQERENNQNHLSPLRWRDLNFRTRISNINENDTINTNNFLNSINNEMFLYRNNLNYTSNEWINNRSFEQMFRNSNINSIINNNNENNYTNSELLLDEVNDDYQNNEEEGNYQEPEQEVNIEEVFTNLENIINNEKEKIKQDKEKLINLRKKYQDFQKEYIKSYNQKIIDWGQSLNNKMDKKYSDNDIVKINVGGTNIYSIKRGILKRFPNSVLFICFSGQCELPKKDGAYFVDRNSTTFEMLLYYLKTLNFPKFENEIYEENFYNELDFWKIPIKSSNPNFTFNSKWCASTLKIENNGKTLIKNNVNHGIVFITPPMNAFNPYIKYKITINSQFKNNSILFIGLVDITKYKKQFLLSTYWKESPSSFYWDVSNMQLIKIDETGTQVVTKSGYGCKFDEVEEELAMEYDQRNKTLTFYKNDLNLGIAFHNVPPNLTPSIDLWFEKGSINICDTKGPEEKLFL